MAWWFCSSLGGVISLSTILANQMSYPDEFTTDRLSIKKKLTFGCTVFYTIFLKSSEIAIGSVQMFDGGEIWYQISSDFRNQGYVTEAISKIISTSTAPSFYLSICSTNLASLRVAEKLGFQCSETRGAYKTFTYSKP